MTTNRIGWRVLATSLAASLALVASGATAQVQTIDPNAAIDGDLAPNSAPTAQAPAATPAGAEAGMLPALPADAPAPVPQSPSQ